MLIQIGCHQKKSFRLTHITRHRIYSRRNRQNVRRGRIRYFFLSFFLKSFSTLCSFAQVERKKRKKKREGNTGPWRNSSFSSSSFCFFSLNFIFAPNVPTCNLAGKCLIHGFLTTPINKKKNPPRHHFKYLQQGPKEEWIFLIWWLILRLSCLIEGWHPT